MSLTGCLGLSSEVSTIGACLTVLQRLLAPLSSVPLFLSAPVVSFSENDAVICVGVGGGLFRRWGWRWIFPVVSMLSEHVKHHGKSRNVVADDCGMS